MLLAVADILYGRDALTSVAARPATLMQGVLSMLLASGIAMIAMVGAVALWISSNFESRRVWQTIDRDGDHESERSIRDAESEHAAQDDEGNGQAAHGRTLRALVVATAIAAVVILVDGFFLSISADVIAARTGIAS